MVELPVKEFTFEYSRSGGPGGQNVNKTSSKVTLRWALSQSSLPKRLCEKVARLKPKLINKQGELVLTSSRFREQGRNIADCLNKLQLILQEASRPEKRRVATKPPKGAVAERLKEKKKRGALKQERSKKSTPDW